MAGESRLTTAAAFVLDAVRGRLPEGRFVVALSGGADSAVAAWVIAEIAGADEVRGVHVHHGLDASADLAAAAARVAKTLGIAFTRVDVAVPEGASFEGQAREIRLSALAGAARPDEWLVTGHHSDDSVETVFINLLRGAGATGLSGIPQVRGRWIRPLLDLERSRIRAAADELQLPYLDDPSNADPRHRRNVIRSDVLPWLEERLGIPVHAVIRRSADSLAADDTELTTAAEVVPIGSSAGAVTVPAVVLATLPDAVAARVVRRALRRVHPPYPGNAADIAAVLRVAGGSTPRESLSGGFQAVLEGALVAVYDTEPAPARPQALVPGTTVEFGFWRVTASAVSAVRSPALGRFRTRARASVLTGETTVRGAAAGERIDLRSGSKLVRDAMREAGVPVRLRSAWPIVAVGGKIAWVAGARVAGWARLESAGEPAIELSMEGTGV